MASSIIYKIRNSKKGIFPLFRLLPNIVTLASLCITLTAIRFSMVGDYLMATSLLLFAGFLDGIDGRLARFFNASNDFGAQLDSLVDFVNFGVAPGFIVYFWVNSYGDILGFDWAMVLMFAVCASIRLARFNVDLKDDKANPILEKYFFKGIPSPVGAALATLPMVLFYEFDEGFYCNQTLVICFILILAIMMASRVPTISIKKIPIKNNNFYLTSLILGSIIFGLIVRPWLTLSIIGLVYFFSIPVTIFYFVKISNQAKNK